MSISIRRADGSLAPFNADRINRSIERACIGLTDPISKVTQIATETQLTLHEGITTEEMDKATINAAVQNIKEDPEYDKVATRLLLKTIYRKVIGEYDKDDYEDLKKKHRDAFISYIKEGVKNKTLHPNMESLFDLESLADTLNLDRDELFLYAGLDGLAHRYMIKDTKSNVIETPQYFFMRVAMGLSYVEKNPTEYAKKFYHKMSKHEYIAGGSANLGAGTPSSSLSNCFLLEVHDDMQHIAKSVSDVLLLSKSSGGLGVSITKLRASGSPLKSGFGGASSGPTPFAKIMDTSIRAVMRGGKKVGALCFYMEPWHLDFTEFIDWKNNSGDDHARMRTANTAVYIADEFMKRSRDGKDWYMFDPAETPDLNELYGQAFSKRYTEYVDMADKGMMRAFKKIPANELFRKILVSMQTTSHPWLVWKDTINLRALNNNTGTIHMSNLCTEICLPQDRENVAVCNLASINLAAHVSNKQVNWGKLEESARLAVRQLDNLIDINMLPIPEAVKSDKENRAMGLGVMGFADVIEKLGMAYDSEHAWDFADRIFEFVSYMAIDESANLAQERGNYKHFEGSMWSKGKVPIDSIENLERDRGIKVSVVRDSKHRGLNWNLLREKVKKGMRNSTLMAVAPNANIGLVAGTTPGIDARFAQVFSRNKISGKYMDLNHNLVNDLKNMGIWEKVRDQIIENQGDIAQIEGIPQYLKDIYKTSFTTSPYAYIEVAARAQKWVDQALSRNMYLETRDLDETMAIYATAWEKGLKSTYYLHLKPRHTAEQSTVRVNKAEKMGKIGFAAVAKAKIEQQSPIEKEVEVAFSMPKQSAIPVASITQKVPENYKPSSPILHTSTPVINDTYTNTQAKTIPHSEPVLSTYSEPVISSIISDIQPKEPAIFGFGAIKKQNEIENIMDIKEQVSVHSVEEVINSAKYPQINENNLNTSFVQNKYSDITSIGMITPREQVPIVNKPKIAPKVCPIDPAERAQCDSCQ